MKKQLVIRNESFSFLLERKTLLTTTILAILTFAAFVVSIGTGEMYISPINVIKTLFGAGEKQYELVIETFRLPRILVALLIGAALSVSGSILQGIIRNPLASPDIVGITHGASVAAVGLLTLFPTVSVFWLPPVTLIGAGVVAAIIYLLAWKDGVTPIRLVLIGVGIKEVMAAITSLLVVTSPIYLTPKVQIWITGTVYGSNWENVSVLLPWVILMLILTMMYGRTVNVLQLGDDIAAGVGSPVSRHRLILLFFSVALAGAAIAIGGAISFVGLLGPHIARKLVGPSFGGLLPVSAMVGALIVMLSDLIGRTAFSPLDLPVGIFTSAIGAPFFIYLLFKNRNQ
ncbi:FecCD family ABC transporter permease [Brevibacillus dissolubilis]|uniref:FecCD family ABC transporter permease n=1 Tax=Brevibacillus dissolubilis TaxID=1844116 RepID=UPI001116C165|nr:iron ABC transporter permease [Brevibacillus dissolubilis]